MKKRRVILAILVILVVGIIAYIGYKGQLEKSFVIKGEVESALSDSILLNVEYSDSKVIDKEETPMVYLKNIGNPGKYKKGDKITARCGQEIQPMDPPYVFVIEVLE